MIASRVRERAQIPSRNSIRRNATILVARSDSASPKYNCADGEYTNRGCGRPLADRSSYDSSKCTFRGQFMKRIQSHALALAILLGTGCACLAADPPAKDKGNDGPMPDLAAALKATPGCLGVETAQTASGKTVIFAWFEDKKAALAWYNSDTHRQVMKRFFSDYKSNRKPLADVPDDSGPIMAIASITLTAKPTKENSLPFKQIGIELYQPLGGGLSIGGKFAPDKMKVPEARKDKPK